MRVLFFMGESEVVDVGLDLRRCARCNLSGTRRLRKIGDKVFFRLVCLCQEERLEWSLVFPWRTARCQNTEAIWDILSVANLFWNSRDRQQSLEDRVNEDPADLASVCLGKLVVLVGLGWRKDTVFLESSVGTHECAAVK